MSQPQYALSWDSYKTNICSGFSSLQQNGEFVDMTIAADGHLVKVHQVLVALASPFLKELIASAPCQHPVIFLNNVSHKVLSYLLEYIYTGEAIVPSENLSGFMEAAKSLHIKGLEGITSSEDHTLVANDDTYSVISHQSHNEQEVTPKTRGTKRKANISIETLDSSMVEEPASGDDFDYSNSSELIASSGLRLKEDPIEIKYNDVITDFFTEITPYKGDSRWFSRGGHFYVVTRTRKNWLSLRCASNECTVTWSLRGGKPGPIKGQHNHKPTPWVPNRNAMFQELKGSVTRGGMSLKQVYTEVAAKYPDAAPHLLYDNVLPSMRKWRKNAQEESLHT